MTVAVGRGVFEGFAVAVGGMVAVGTVVALGTGVSVGTVLAVGVCVDDGTTLAVADAVAVAVAGGGVLVTTMMIGSGVGTTAAPAQLTQTLSISNKSNILDDIALLATIFNSLTYVMTFVDGPLHRYRPHR